MDTQHRIGPLSAAMALGGILCTTFAVRLSPVTQPRLLVVVAAVSFLIISTVILTAVYREPPDPISLATHLTIFRGYASGTLLIPIVLLQTTPTALATASAFYGTAAFLDYLDGTVARKRNNVTSLGTTLDMRLDSTGILFAAVLGTLAGVVHPAYLLVGAARYVFLAAIALRDWLGYGTEDLQGSSIARGLAGLQMVFVTIALTPITPTQVTVIASIILTIPTVVVFARDYLRVAGYDV